MINWIMRQAGYIPESQYEYMAERMFSRTEEVRRQRDNLSDLLERKQRTIDCQIETIEILRRDYSE